MAREIDDETAAMGDGLFEQHRIAITEPLEAALESLLEAGEDVPRRFRVGLSTVLMRLCAWCFSIYFAMVGTSVHDKMKEASIAKMTASAIGMNSQPETPLRSNSGSQTIAMASVATNVGRRSDWRRR